MQKAPNDSDLAGNFYTVKAGDTLDRIAKMHNIPRQEIIEANGITDERKLKVGQMLFLPDQNRIFEKLKSLEKKTLPSDRAATPLAFSFPLKKGKIIYRFSKAKKNPYDGIGIAAPLGSPVASAQSGKVLFAGDDKTKFGLFVILLHEEPYITVYAHLATSKVKTGQTVNRGEIIGTVGTSGGVKVPHLHFQLRVKKIPQDPVLYLERGFSD